jgi:hypothetical protein
MKTYYFVVCGLTVEAADDDTAREIVYEVCRNAGIEVHIEYVQLNEQGESND